MKKFAVGFISLYDNELTIEVIEASDWHTALSKHTKLGTYELSSKSLAHAKRDAFDCDSAIDVIEL